MFLSDYPCILANCLRLWRFPALDALAVAPALAVASLLATPCLSVLLLRLPPRPLPRLPPALCAAIALARLPRMKSPLAAFQQTTPSTRPASPALPPLGRLIFARTCNTLGRAHGRSSLPEAPALEGNATPLQGAVDLRLIREIKTLTHQESGPREPLEPGVRASQRDRFELGPWSITNSFLCWCPQTFHSGTAVYPYVILQNCKNARSVIQCIRTERPSVEMTTGTGAATGW
jgi:hypothetical protein